MVAGGGAVTAGDGEESSGGGAVVGNLGIAGFGGGRRAPKRPSPRVSAAKLLHYQYWAGPRML